MQKFIGVFQIFCTSTSSASTLTKFVQALHRTLQWRFLSHQSPRAIRHKPFHSQFEQVTKPQTCHCQVVVVKNTPVVYSFQLFLDQISTQYEIQLHRGQYFLVFEMLTLQFLAATFLLLFSVLGFSFYVQLMSLK